MFSNSKDAFKEKIVDLEKQVLDQTNAATTAAHLANNLVVENGKLSDVNAQLTRDNRLWQGQNQQLQQLLQRQQEQTNHGQRAWDAEKATLTKAKVDLENEVRSLSMVTEQVSAQLRSVQQQYNSHLESNSKSKAVDAQSSGREAALMQQISQLQLERQRTDNLLGETKSRLSQAEQEHEKIRATIRDECNTQHQRDIDVLKRQDATLLSERTIMLEDRIVKLGTELENQKLESKKAADEYGMEKSRLIEEIERLKLELGDMFAKKTEEEDILAEEAEIEDSNNAASLRKLKELIRLKYKLDVSIWSRSDCLKRYRPEVEKDMVKADMILRQIEDMVQLWVHSPKLWSEEAWEDAEKIKRRILSPGKKQWVGHPPWNDKKRTVRRSDRRRASGYSEPEFEY